MQAIIEKAVNVLKRGGVILYPTDTVWGIGCDATNSEAVNKIIQIKKSPENKSMIILLDSADKLYYYVGYVPEIANRLIEVAVNPLTIVYPQARNIAENLTANDGSIAIRITKDKFCKSLIEKFKKPIVSTSANISGGPVPKSFKDIPDIIKQQMDYIVNLRQNEIAKSKPSGIIKIDEKNRISIIRK
ncbi:MAG: L-threonylcarbamoyladenylate synthase [Marinilabiliales bacterium]